MKGYRKLKANADGSYNLKAGRQYIIKGDCVFDKTNRAEIVLARAVFENREVKGAAWPLDGS